MSKNPKLRSCTFFVEGEPIPKGSGRAVIHKHTGKPLWLPASKKTKPWEEKVKAAAEQQWAGGPSDKAFQLVVTFIFKRPKFHHRTGRFAKLLKPSAPGRHSKQPDFDKLLRTIGDALTGVVYADDGQVAHAEVTKAWAGDFHNLGREGVLVTAEELN